VPPTIHVTYVDLKSAFIYVDWSAFWLAFYGIDTPDTVLNLLRDLHSRSVLARALLCCALDWIMEYMSVLKGINLGRYTVTDLDYADDITLPSSQLQDLERCLSGFSAAARTMGLNMF